MAVGNHDYIKLYTCIIYYPHPGLPRGKVTFSHWGK